MCSCLVEPSVPISTQIKKRKSPSNRAFLRLQCSDVFLEKVFEFFVGEHLVDELEDGACPRLGVAG